MGSDQKTTSKNGRKHFFDNHLEDMERVKPLLDLDLWAREFGAEELDDLVKKLAAENRYGNDTYKLADCFIECIENDGIPKDESVAKSDNYAFFKALIDELGIEPQTVKYVKDNYFDITLPMSEGPFTVSVKPFDPYVPEPWRSEIAKKADDQEDDGKRVDPRWHYFVSWAKYKDVILNSNSEYAAMLRERDVNYANAKNPCIGGFSNQVMKKWLRKS